MTLKHEYVHMVVFLKDPLCLISWSCTFDSEYSYSLTVYTCVAQPTYYADYSY